MLKDAVGLVEHHEKAFCALCNRLVLTRVNDDAVLSKARRIDEARIETYTIHSYLPHYTLSTTQRGIITEQFSEETPMEFRYIERYVFLKNVNDQNVWKVELRPQQEMSSPMKIVVESQ